MRLARALEFPRSNSIIANLRETVIVREEKSQDGTDSKKVLDLERIDIGVMGGLVVVQHEIDNVARGSNEEELEGGEVERLGESPEEVYRQCHPTC